MLGQMDLQEYWASKERIREKLNETVDSFLVIGYELRQIRDTESYRLDGYENLADFAKKEYNLGRDTVSRFISISVRLTVDGEGLQLLPELRGLGYSKLQDVLQLPPDDYQLLTPQTTVREIRDLRKFNHGDDTAERMAVPLAEASLTPLQRCVRDFFSDPGQRRLLNEVLGELAGEDYAGREEAIDRKLADRINPSGSRTHRKGLVYLFLYDYDKGVAYKQMGKPVPERMSWHAFLQEVLSLFRGCLDGDAWENAFGPAPKEEAEIPGQMDIGDFEKDKPSKPAPAKTERTPAKPEKTPAKAEREPKKSAQTSEVQTAPEDGALEAGEGRKEPVEAEYRELPADRKEVKRKIYDCWDRAGDGAKRLAEEMEDAEVDELDVEGLRELYSEAVDVAADLERILALWGMLG